MKNKRYFSCLILGCIVSTMCSGQSAFNTCSAAFLGNKMIVDTYTTVGKCRLSTTATGQLTVNTVELSSKASKAVDRILFKVAIRDGQTKTLTMFSNEAVKQVNVQNVLTKCQKGDYIVLLTTNAKYALPHNEILVR